MRFLDSEEYAKFGLGLVQGGGEEKGAGFSWLADAAFDSNSSRI